MKYSLKQVHEGELLPRFSAVAWFNPNRMSYTVLPVPFHWPARWLRGFWRYIRLGYCPGVVDRVSHDAYRAGLQTGYALQKYMLAREFQKGVDHGTERGIRLTLIALGENLPTPAPASEALRLPEKN